MATTLTPATNQKPRNPIPAARSGSDTLRTVPFTVKAEWIKLISLRSAKTTVALTAAIGAFLSWAIASFVTGLGLTAVDVFSVGTMFTAVFASVSGILLFTSESQHGTLAPTVAAQPARSVIAGSKAAVAAAYGAFLGAAGLVAGIAGASLSSIDMGDASTMLSTGLWAMTFTTLAAVLGLGIGMIARVSTAAVSGLLVWWLVAESLFGMFLPESVSRLLPFAAGNNLLGISSGSEEGVSELALSAAESALVFGGYAAAAVAIGTVLLYRRDAS